ncbi:uncharacterized protein PHALS_06558 [Plasmopara halstedii]|uniref:Uncharacterized protein n=1 Tax=Plasmopara halstedii TaxID=4781 RepID=A0A0P1B234_PLAHL|nr:uncharacterized protein PHALS_06558 [Plasmopara halstedii]CEG48753.1 hypothetical protein PHALS_06558 [Plasmopara halstedii]|eukprot:XP_024585122.1 hypothetical protein PHALS_06558 [Plasmopara halstedii]
MITGRFSQELSYAAIIVKYGLNLLVLFHLVIEAESLEFVKGITQDMFLSRGMISCLFYFETFVLLAVNAISKLTNTSKGIKMK